MQKIDKFLDNNVCINIEYKGITNSRQLLLKDFLDKINLERKGTKYEPKEYDNSTSSIDTKKEECATKIKEAIYNNDA